MERYIITNPQPLHFKELTALSQKVIPSRKIKMPGSISKGLLLFIAGISETISKLTRKEPLLIKNDVKEFWGANPSASIDKAIDDLGFMPLDIERSVADTMSYIGR